MTNFPRILVMENENHESFAFLCQAAKKVAVTTALPVRKRYVVQLESKGSFLALKYLKKSFHISTYWTLILIHL